MEASVYLSPSEETLGIIKTIKKGVEIEIRKGKVYAQRECERERMWGREEI